MSYPTESDKINEVDWIKVYMDVAGVSEASARSAFMYLGCRDAAKTEDECVPEPNGSSAE